MKNSTEYLKRAKVPRINTPEAFNLDKYIEKDRSPKKTRAAYWGHGNFKDLVRNNMER